MSFNPHEILQRLRSQQNTNHSSGGSSSNYTNSNPPNTNNNFESNGESMLGLQQHPQPFNQAQYNNIQLQANFNNNNNSNFHQAQGNRSNNNNQFVSIGQQQQAQQQYAQSSAHNSLRNNSNVTGGRLQQGQAQISPSTDSIRNNNNRQFNNTQQIQQIGNQAGMNRLNQRVQDKLPQNEGNSGNRIDQQYEELNNLNSNSNENDSNNNTNNIQNGNNNTNSIVEYLLDKVMENAQQKQNNVQDKRNNSSNSNPSQFPKQTISPSRRAHTETLYDEVAQVISKEPVQKILQKKEKNFVSCASTNSKRFHAPKVAGKLNLEQLQKILTDYPSLSRPSLNIRITEADLMQ